VIGATNGLVSRLQLYWNVLQGRATLGDILLCLFILNWRDGRCLFQNDTTPVRYLIYIAITALARVLIEIVGASIKREDYTVISGAILLLSFRCPGALDSARTDIRPISPAADLGSKISKKAEAARATIRRKPQRPY